MKQIRERGSFLIITVLQDFFYMCFLTYFCVQSERYEGFEGLRAEECGILNGCENGRCVRVREGYTCDCFDGYEFDLNKMACIGGFSTQHLLTFPQRTTQI